MKNTITISNEIDHTFSLRFKMPLMLVRLFNYEYWPFWILFFPLVFYWLLLSLRSKSLTWFTATNPGIEMGGFFGESKINILNKIPTAYLPVTLFFDNKPSVKTVIAAMKDAEIDYPVIAKPDQGEMGFQVAKITSAEELKEYLINSNGKLIIQEFIPYETELGILYYRYPDGSKSGITSVVKKKFLSVTGDGVSSVEQLMQQSDRSRFQLHRMKYKFGDKMQFVLNNGEMMLLEPIGNHCRGTEFIDGIGLITPKLVTVFDSIAKNMEGFYYGRFDLKVKSIDDLYIGKNIRIMEVNGVSSEPAHIYDRKMNLWKVYTQLFKHATIVSHIARQNKERGAEYVSFSVLIKTIVQHFRQKKANAI